MKNRLSIAIVLVTAISCKQGVDDVTTPSTSPTTSPVETNQANTTYRPAFSGQTRVNSVSTTTAYSSSVVTSSLASP